MRKSLQFALAAGSMLILAPAAMAQNFTAQDFTAQGFSAQDFTARDFMAQDSTVRLSPLFLVQPQTAQEYAREYAPYSVLPSMNWRAPVFPHTWHMQTWDAQTWGVQTWDVRAVPFTLEETRAPDRASKPD